MRVTLSTIIAGSSENEVILELIKGHVNEK